MKKRLSLRSKIVIFLIAFVILILSLTYVFQTVFLEDFYRISKINTIESIGKQLASEIESGQFDDNVNSYSLSNEVCIRTISNNENYNCVRACALENLDDETINTIASETMENDNEKLFLDFKYRNLNGKEPLNIIIFSKLIEVNQEKIMILVSSMITPLNDTISTIKSQYIIIVLVVVLMSLVLALILSRYVVKPLKIIDRESSNLSKGKYNGEILNNTTKEFIHLNQTLTKANEDILKADRAKKELLANVSHDLRTPLTMIVGYGEMMRDLPSEQNQENFNVIIDEAKRLSSLVDDLVDVSRFEVGNYKLNKQIVSINKLLTNVYHQYENYCKAQGVDFSLKLSEDKEVEIDELRIKQVLYNFVNNALNYNNNKKQKVIIGSELVEQKLRIYVYDNGDGIKKENIENIWDRYYKVDKAHVRQHLGSGIGLSLAKELLIAHNFEYGVQSEFGSYAKFYFDIEL